MIREFKLKSLARFGFLLALAGFLALGGIGQASASQVKTSDKSVSIQKRIQPKLAQQLDRKGFKLGSPIFIRIFKQSSELELWIKGPGPRYYLFKTYEICDYSGGLGPKLQTGDKQSPEGVYHVDANSFNPNSRFHLSFDLGYPNAYDAMQGRTGNYLMVHGQCESVGCYAMTNKFIEEIYFIAQAAIEAGNQDMFWVHVFPFKMTSRQMRQHLDTPEGQKWGPFWGNLKQAYDYFETYRRPPHVAVAKGTYIFF